jgi:hypothetical protein
MVLPPAVVGRTFMSPRVSLTSFLMLLVCLAAARPVHAQDRRLEVGGQLATLTLSDSDTTNAGFGGRVSYDLTNWLAAEAEMNLFGSDSFETRAAAFPDFRLTYNRRRVDGFFGPKVGWRGERFGLFGKVRPGFARLSDKGLRCEGEPCTRMLLARPLYRSEFALDVGAVVEFYPTARTVTRVDLGSTMIRHRSSAPPCRDCSSSNFASRVGVGVRF